VLGARPEPVEWDGVCGLTLDRITGYIWYIVSARLCVLAPWWLNRGFPAGSELSPGRNVEYFGKKVKKYLKIELTMCR
jgi:hypothetical protein